MLAFGTRPEAIKLAPVCKEICNRSDRLRLVCCITGQQRDLLGQMLIGLQYTFGLRSSYSASRPQEEFRA
jgi:UDP-N-acetylglucosamine 2-epimerase